MIKQTLAVLMVAASGTCVAGELVIDATVLEVANTNSGGADFAVKIDGGFGICAGPRWITFPESRKASVASFNQAFAAALAALASDKKVRIHNFIDDSCAGASFISISK